ncbi:uncharacterized protein LOC125521996 [Triticum urartu]|uniref:Oligopeptidase A N-terminal domain-containing protein n=1 Tax=Triticum urartu TaxID=4572 RepID=A0A8R7R3B1_TRIUA|nr:uncharacterized protein LOC125521996 [Triticum urartu]XP_048543015.1 uncharacterized protein LOC125521996 [Triticum urartu]
MERQTSFRLGMLEKLKSFRGMDNFRRSKDSPGKRGDTPLHLAARASNVSNIQRILAESGQEMAELEEGELEELEKGVEPAWERLVHPLERIIDRLNLKEFILCIRRRTSSRSATSFFGGPETHPWTKLSRCYRSTRISIKMKSS